MRRRSPSATGMNSVRLSIPASSMRPVDRDGDIAKKECDPAGMVLVGVREHHALDPVGVLAQIREVGQDEIDAGHVGVGEHEPAVDDEDSSLDLEAEAVPPDLAQPAEKDEPHFLAHRADATDRTRPASGQCSHMRYAVAVSRSFETSSSVAYSSPVSVQSSNWITPSSVNRSRSQPSPASSSPSFLQLGTIFENSIDWNTLRSGACITMWTASFTLTPKCSKTSCWRNRSRMRTAASNANSWRSRISGPLSCW